MKHKNDARRWTACCRNASKRALRRKFKKERKNVGRIKEVPVQLQLSKLAGKAQIHRLIVSSTLQTSHHFVKSRFPGKLPCHPNMGLHRDLINLIGHIKHVVTLGSFSRDSLVEDENRDAPEKFQNEKQKCELSAALGITITIGRLRLTRVVFIK